MFVYIDPETRQSYNVTAQATARGRKIVVTHTDTGMRVTWPLADQHRDRIALYEAIIAGMLDCLDDLA